MAISEELFRTLCETLPLIVEIIQKYKPKLPKKLADNLDRIERLIEAGAAKPVLPSDVRAILRRAAKKAAEVMQEEGIPITEEELMRLLIRHYYLEGYRYLDMILPTRRTNTRSTTQDSTEPAGERLISFRWGKQRRRITMREPSEFTTLMRSQAMGLTLRGSR